MNTRILNDLCHRAEALAQDLRTLQEPLTDHPGRWIACSERMPTKEDGSHVIYKSPTNATAIVAPWNAPSFLPEFFWMPIPPLPSPAPAEAPKPSPEWTPRFKVGDRVMEIEDRACHVWTVEKIQCPGYFLHKPEIHGGYSSCWRSDEQLRAAPWTLSRHIPGFRPLEEGEQWHRGSEFKDGMLSVGERPLLVGESMKKGDQFYNTSHPERGWEVEVVDCGHPYGAPIFLFKTSRPIP